MAIYYQNDCAVEIEDLFDERANSGAGEYISSGTVTAQLVDIDGANIGAAITMSYSTLKNGVSGHWWTGIIEEDVAVTLGQAVDVVVTAIASSDRVYKATQRHQVVRRT